MRRSQLFTLVMAIAAVPSGAAADRQPLPEHAHAPVPDVQTVVTPPRRVTDVPTPAAAPALPPAAARLDPLTIEIAVAQEPASARRRRQTITRTADRVHIQGGDAREWLFEQNSRDPLRVSGTLIDHVSRTIVTHAESDLRMLMGIRGWTDVLLLWFDVETLRAYRPTRDWQLIGGVKFIRYAPADIASRASHVWWSEDHLLAREAGAPEPAGRSRSAILEIRAGIDRSLLELPASRFPGYRVMSIADWLEHRQPHGVR